MKESELIAFALREYVGMLIDLYVRKGIAPLPSGVADYISAIAKVIGKHSSAGEDKSGEPESSLY